MRRFLAIAAILAAAFSLHAQDSSKDALDALFEDEMVIVEEPAKAGSDPVASALRTESVRIGGKYSGDASVSATWLDPWNGSFDPLDPDSHSISGIPGATLFFDARPDEDYRVYGSAKTSWPFSNTVSGVAVPDIRVFELFADYSLDDRVFFRFGKSTVSWGVGYFWSPADVINLGQISVFDPESQREGPVNFRMHLPILGTQTNLYTYAILDQDNVQFETTALAAKAEVVFGGFEAGLGAWYRNDTAERAMATLSGSIGQVSVFGELSGSRGSAKTFVTRIGPGPTTFVTSTPADHRDSYYWSGTAGFMWRETDLNLTAIGQYYYNGEGYADADREALISQAHAVMTNFPAAAAGLQTSLKGLIYGSGRHYGAFSLIKNELFVEDLSASVLVVANLSDQSGIVKATMGWQVADRMKISAGPLFAFGGEDSEYVLLSGGPALTLTLSATLGSGSF